VAVPAAVAEKPPAKAAKVEPKAEAKAEPKVEAKAETKAEAEAKAKKEKTTFADKKAAKREAERNDVARKMSVEGDKTAPARSTGSRSEASPTTALAAKEERKLATRTRGEAKETSVWTYVGVGFIFGLALLGVYRVVLSLLH